MLGGHRSEVRSTALWGVSVLMYGKVCVCYKCCVHTLQCNVESLTGGVDNWVTVFL